MEARDDRREGTALEPSEELMLFLDSVAVATLIHDADGRIVLANEEAARMLGRTRGQLEGGRLGDGAPLLETTDGSMPAPSELPPVAARLTGEMRSLVVHTAGAGAPERWLKIEARALPGGQAVATTLTDVTDHVERERQLSHAAHHDALTALPNRAFAREHLAHVLARAERRGWAVALLFVDLDHFKSINDTFGHAVGDEVLRLFARRMTTVLRTSDFVARHGGDEFLVIAADFGPGPIGSGISNSEAATIVANRIARRIASAFEEPLIVDGGEHVVTASIGICVTAPPAADADELLRAADEAMYVAKGSGDGGVRFFEPVATRSTRAG